MRDLVEQGVRHHPVGLNEADIRNRPAIDALIGHTFRKLDDVQSVSVGLGCQSQELGEATEPDHDLPAIGVCLGQKTLGVTKQLHLAIHPQIHDPGLPVVGVWGQNRVRDRAQAWIVIRLAGSAPWREGTRRATGHHESATTRRQNDGRGTGNSKKRTAVDGHGMHLG